MIYIGTSGFYYKGWNGVFYPENVVKDRLLEYYAQHFKSVEINTSFYHLLRAETVEKWVSEVPDDFVFSFKGSRIITHTTAFGADREAIHAFFKPLYAATRMQHRHIVLFQLPATHTLNLRNLRLLAEQLPDSFRYALELRHPSWFTEEVYDLCRMYGIAIVINDSPRLAGRRLWPMKDISTASFSYFRMHGSRALYASSYDSAELDAYAHLMKQKHESGTDIFCYFNNDASGYAVRNAKELIERIIGLSAAFGQGPGEPYHQPRTGFHGMGSPR